MTRTTPLRAGLGLAGLLLAALLLAACSDPGGERLGAEGRAALLQQVVLPGDRPLIAQIRAAVTGEIWVRPAGEIREMDREALRVGTAAGWGGTDWEVLDADGLLLERVRLPDKFTPTSFTEDGIYGILTDDLGVQSPGRVR